MSYLIRHLRGTSQRRPLTRSHQVRNSAGGHAWPVDDWTRLNRFLVLGSAGGSHYANERTLSRANTRAVIRCVEENGPRAVRDIVATSVEGWAPSNEPAVFALAVAAGRGDEATRRLALEALPEVCRTGTHLFRFVQFVELFRGWGRSLRRAVGRWYAEQELDALAYSAVKYRQRDGMTHRDVLRLAHPGASVSSRNPGVEVSERHARLFEWIVRGGPTDGMPRIVEGFTRVQAAESPRAAADLAREYRLPREALRPEHLRSAEVWEALLEDMQMTALVRNLATLTRVGLVTPGAEATARVLEQLGDGERIRRARVHPLALLIAQRTYASANGMRGRRGWKPVAQVVDALDAAFYTAFANVEPSGKRVLLALDVSMSMARGSVAGAPWLTPREASAAMALVTAATEQAWETVAFFAGDEGLRLASGPHGGWADGIAPIPISPSQRLADAVRTVSDLPYGGTDCALPMLYALEREREVDAFVIYTDSETWAGAAHPAEALRLYRVESGIDARLIVVGMVSEGFTIADPDDRGMLDVVGFDAATPAVVSGFAAGRI